MVPGSLVYADFHLPSRAIPATPENPSNFFPSLLVVLSVLGDEKLWLGARNLPIKRKGGPKLIWLIFERFMTLFYHKEF